MTESLDLIGRQFGAGMMPFSSRQLPGSATAFRFQQACRGMQHSVAAGALKPQSCAQAISGATPTVTREAASLDLSAINAPAEVNLQ